MAQSATRSRSRQASGRKPKPSVPLTQMLVLDALRTWVVPTIAAVVGTAVFIVYNVGGIETAPAVTIVGTLGLLVTLFYGLRSFTEQAINVRLGVILGIFIVLWSAVTYYPFFRTLNPGTPLFSSQLKRGAPALTVPMHGAAGHYNLIVEGHFMAVEGRQNRTGTYQIALAHAGGAADAVLEGTFSEEWRSQRFGAGRRSSVVPVLSQTNQALNPIEDADGQDLTLKLNDLSKEMRDGLTLKLYSAGIPIPVLVALGVLTVFAAMFVDAWRPKGSSEGLMATLTVSALCAIIIFRASSIATPGFPQLLIAVLLGALAGALLGSFLWRLTRELAKRLPSLS